MADVFKAHISQDGRVHGLEEHLTEVSKLAAEFAKNFNAESWASLAGLWHDLGKYRPAFQKYLKDVTSTKQDAHIEGKSGRVTHSTAGALWAKEYLADRFGKEGEYVSIVLTYLIAGHHAGLDNWNDGLKPRLTSEGAIRERNETIEAKPPETILRPDFSVPKYGKREDIPMRFALWVRMLFSCLVDADFLDTEFFMNKEKSDARKDFLPISELFALFETKMAQLKSYASQSSVNNIREQILNQCCEKASLDKRVFTLTVPTGGGKTLSSLAFALRHAIAHGKDRIIYAIPYTSIIEQTADIFSGIFGEKNVIEHHSNVESLPGEETARSRLACENWDAPIIVTTNVQLFESLFARRTSRCRKLHNIANSVIVLDEAQLLPVEFLQPILNVLRLLVRDFNVTLVLCTATQPSLVMQAEVRGQLKGFCRDEVVEIIDDVPALYASLKRVQVHRPTNLNISSEWTEIAEKISQHEASLTIVNRRKDARRLFHLLKQRDFNTNTLWHLSALMCANHRSKTIDDIKRALEARRIGKDAEKVVVISTQLIEAGVDVDFPVVFRALAGLDSIAQAAGRCNREGKLDSGEVHVFVPPSEPPPGLLRQARDTCRTVWRDAEGEPLEIGLFKRYFDRLYNDFNLDKNDICKMLKVGQEGDVRFRDASDAFRLIDDDDSATVIVRYPVGSSDEIDRWITLLEQNGPQRWLLRKVQRYTVTIYQKDLVRLLGQGHIREMTNCPALYVQHSDSFYDSETGANVDGAPGDPAQNSAGD